MANPPLTVAVTTTAAPSDNATVPVGLPADAATNAVTVIGWPVIEGLVDEVSAVVVAIATTVCASGGLTLAPSVASPE